MTTKLPVIFISSVSKELRSTRNHVANTLTDMGYDPSYEDIAPVDQGDLLGVLRKWIDQSDAVIQLVGHCYGLALQEDHPQFGPCSHTQYEAHYARQQGKKIYYLLIDPDHPIDGCGCESASLHDLQAQYRQLVRGYGHLYHNSDSLTRTESLVHKMNLPPSPIRDFPDVEPEEQKKIRADFHQRIENIKGGTPQKLSADYDAVLRQVTHTYAIRRKSFSTILNEDVDTAFSDASTPLKDRVRALKAAGKFTRARDEALKRARRLEIERQRNSKEEVELWTEVARTTLAFGVYDKALEYATKAPSQTDRQADFPTWSAARHQQGQVLGMHRFPEEARALFEELVKLQEEELGLNDPAVLKSRINLALIHYKLGHYDIAEQLGRALVVDCQSVYGPGHHDTLMIRGNLANVLYTQGKYDEAEHEHREVLKIMERVLGAEHPDTLKSKMNLANAINDLGRHVEAEKLHQTVWETNKRVLGPDHPETLKSWDNLAIVQYSQRNFAKAEHEHGQILKDYERVLGAEHPNALNSCGNLAEALYNQGKHVEAEKLYREVLLLRERVLGKQHPNVALSGFNLALCLEAQQKLPEALALMQRAEQVWEKVLAADHPRRQAATAARERLEAALKQEPPK